MEGGGARPDGANDQSFHPFHHPAYGRKPADIPDEILPFRVDRVRDRYAEGNAMLIEDIHDGKLAAERVAPAGDVELIEIVRIRLHEDRHVETGQLERIGDPFLVAEVREAHQDAVDAITIAPDQPFRARPIT